MTNAGYGVPDMISVRSRVHLSTLTETESGDVFYLASDPVLVYLRGTSRVTDKHTFLLMEDEVWRLMEHVGTGDPSQRVVVLHNTEKYRAPPAGGC